MPTKNIKKRIPLSSKKYKAKLKTDKPENIKSDNEEGLKNIAPNLNVDDYIFDGASSKKKSDASIDVGISIRNISRIEKKVLLFNSEFSDQEIIINSYVDTISYNEIKELIKANKYTVISIYFDIVNGPINDIFSNINMVYHKKILDGSGTYTPVKLIRDMYQFQNSIAFHTFDDEKISLEAGCTVEMVLQANSEIRIMLFLKKPQSIIEDLIPSITKDLK